MRNKKKYIYNKENKRVTKDWRSENGHTLRERERKQLLCKKKENITEKVGKKETDTERIKRNIFTILIFISIRYIRSTVAIINETKTKTIIKIVKLLIIIMTLSYPLYCDQI